MTLAIAWIGVPAAAAPVSVTTYHNDNSRTGWNPNETKLTVANVNSSQFGLKFSVPLDGEVYAQPLYVPQVTIGGVAHNVVVVASENATVYAIDAGSGAILWKHPFADPPLIVASVICHCGTIQGPQGLTGTPTIDVARDSIYVVAHTDEGPTGQVVTHYRLHALLLESGNDRVAATDIKMSAKATDGKTVWLSTTYNMQRPGLAENNGIIYVSFGSQSDRHAASTTGWIAAYDADTLKPIGSLPGKVSTATGLQQVQTEWYGKTGPVRLASIWMSGAAPAIDSAGNIYVQTGNGAYDGLLDWGQSLLKIAPSLSAVLDYFTPSTYKSDNNADRDLGSAGVVLLPQMAGSYNVAVGGGKSGITYLLDEANLGKLQPPGDPNVLFWAQTNFGLWGLPASYIGSDGNTYVMVPGSGPMTSWRVQTSPKPSLVQVGQTPDQFCQGDDCGTIPVISSNGITPGTAIVWAYSRVPNAGPANLTLRAYDASNLSHELVVLPFTHWLGGGMLLTPMVANGMVYAGGESVLNAYGLH